MSKLYNKLFQGRRLTWIKLSVKAKCIYANNYSSVFQNAAFRGRYCCYYDNTKLIQTITGILIFVKQKLTHFAYSHFYFISHWPLADTGCQYIIHDLKTISLKLFATMLIRIVMFFSCYLRMCFFVRKNTITTVQSHVSCTGSILQNCWFEMNARALSWAASYGKKHKMAAECCLSNGANLIELPVSHLWKSHVTIW